MELQRRDFVKAAVKALTASALPGLPSPLGGQALESDTLQHPEIPLPRGLRITTNHRFLCDATTGRPFFLLTDTAWNLNALTYGEIEWYLRDRSARGFSAFMFCLDFYPQASSENAYGQCAYIGGAKTTLNPQYFAYCDYIIRTAAKYRLYAMVVSMWSGVQWGIMNLYSPEQLQALGQQLGARLRHHPNVIHIAGGESSPPYIDVDRVNAIGQGLKVGCEGKHLVTVHPCGEDSASQFFPASSWLDFYMIQGSSSKGGADYDVTRSITNDYNLSVVKPTMIAENYYESGTTQPPVKQRRNLYLSVFAGAFGYAYGHNALWQMSPHTAQKWMLSGWPPGVANWKDALGTTAVKQLHHIRTLLYSRPYSTRIPDQSLILDGQGEDIANRVQAARDGTNGLNDATYIMVYRAAQGAVTLKTRTIAARKLNVWRFSPATGKSVAIKRSVPNNGELSIGNRLDSEDDDVIVVDGTDKNYPSPSMQ